MTISGTVVDQERRLLDGVEVRLVGDNHPVPTAVQANSPPETCVHQRLLER